MSALKLAQVDHMAYQQAYKKINQRRKQKSRIKGSKKLEKVFFYNSSQRDIVTDIAWLTEKLFMKVERVAQ